CRCIESGCVAPVFLDVIDVPRGIGARILHFMSVGAGSSLARFRSCVRIDAELESLAVDVVGERRDAVRKTRGVRNDGSVRGARHLPAVVDHNVLVSGVPHPVRCHGISSLPDQRLAHVATEMVPAVPSHRWSQRESVVEIHTTRLGGARTDQCERQCGNSNAYFHVDLSQCENHWRMRPSLSTRSHGSPERDSSCVDRGYRTNSAGTPCFLRARYHNSASPIGVRKSFSLCTSSVGVRTLVTCRIGESESYIAKLSHGLP